MTNGRPHFSEDAERCIAGAKVLAKRETARRLDPLHVVRAAMALTPEVLQTALAEIGVSGEVTSELPDDTNLRLEEAHELPEMRLVPELLDVVYRGPLAERAQDSKIDLPALITEVLRQPSTRLRNFLVKHFGAWRAENRKDLLEATAKPYRSVRELLAETYQLWIARRAAAESLTGPLSTDAGLLRKPRCPASIDSLLDSLVRIEQRLSQRLEATQIGIFPMTLQQERELSNLAMELTGGLVVQGIFGFPNTFKEYLTARELAQMSRPETYPRNCAEVITALEELEAKDVLCRQQSRGSSRVNDIIGLSTGLVDELLDALATDPITDADIQAFQRRLQVRSR